MTKRQWKHWIFMGPFQHRQRLLRCYPRLRFDNFSFLLPKTNEHIMRAIYVWQQRNFGSWFEAKRNQMGILVLFVTPCRLISLKLFPYQYENCLFMTPEDIRNVFQLRDPSLVALRRTEPFSSAKLQNQNLWARFAKEEMKRFEMI